MAVYEHPAGGFREQTWTMLDAVARTQSPFTFRATTFVWPGERLGCVISLPSLAKEKGQEWEAFFSKLGGGDSFHLGPSEFMETSANNLGIPLTAGLTIGEQVLSEGWTPNVVGAIKAGQWVSIGGRLRRVLNTVDTSPTGTATLRVWPKIGSVSAGTEIVYRNPKGRFVLTEGAPTLTWLVNRRLSEFTFTAQEDDFDHA